MLPNLIIIGAQKCGTSALHFYLEQHPDISMSRPKELDFFVETKNWRRGLAWYEKKWPVNTLVRGEASPNYTAYPIFPGVAEKMARTVPEAKLIFLVRDPIARIASHYAHNYVLRKEHRDFRAAIFDLSQPYLHRSRYMFQLDQFLPYYNREKILILDSADLRNDRSTALQQVFRFLGVNDCFASDKFEQEKHQTAKKERMNALTAWASHNLPRAVFRRLRAILPRGESVAPPRVDEELRAELEQQLKPDADRFRKFCGKSFSHWQV